MPPPSYPNHLHLTVESMKEDKKGKALLRSPKEVNWERRMSMLEDEQAKKGEERSKEIRDMQRAIKELTKGLKDSKPEKKRKRKCTSPNPEEKTKKNSMELMERADDSRQSLF